MSEQISLKEIDGMLDNQQVDNQADSNVTEEAPKETVTFSLADIDAMLDEGEKKPDFAAAKKASDALNGTGSVAKQPTAKTEQKVEQKQAEPKKTPDGEFDYERGEQQTYQDPRSGKDVATQTRWGKGVVEVEAPYASAVEDYDTGTTHAITPSGQSISQTSTDSRGQVAVDSETTGTYLGSDNMRAIVGWNFPGSSYSRLNLIPQGGIDWVKRNPNAYKEQLAELQGKSVQDAVGMYNKLAKGMDDLARVNPDSDTMARLYAIQEYVHAKDLGYKDNTDMRKDGQRYIYYNSYNGSPEIKALMDSGQRFRVDDYLTKAKIAVQSHPLKSVVDIQGAIGELFTPQDKALAWVTAMDNWKRGEASSIEKEYQRLLAEPLKQLHDEIVDRAADPSTAEYVFRSMGFGNDIVNAVLWAGRKLTGTSDKQGTLDLLREGNQKAQDKFTGFSNGAVGGLTMVANWAPAFASGFTTNAVMKGLGMSSGTMARIAGSSMLGKIKRGAAFGSVNLPLFTYFDTVFDAFQNPQSGLGDVVSSFFNEETVRHALAEAPTGAVLSPMAVLGEAFGRAVFRGNKYAAATTGFLGESLAFAGSSSIKKWMEVNERRKKGEDVSFSMKDVWDCTFESVGTLLAMKAGHWGMNGLQGRANTMKNAKGEKVDTEQRKSGADQFCNQGMTEVSAFLYNPRQYAKEHGITDSTDMRSTALGKEWESFLSRYQKGEVKDVDANSVATAMWLIDGKAMLKPISYSTELSADGKTVFSYDSMGNLIEERSFKNREKAEKWQEELRYDAEKYDMAKLEAEAAQRENEMAMQRTLDTMFDEVAGQIPSTLANGEPDPNFNVNTRTEIYNIVANTKSALFILNNVEDLPAEVAEQYRRMVTVGTPFMERYDQLMAANRESLRNRENEGMLRDEVMKIIDKKPSERTAEEHQFMEAYRNSLREKFNETPYVGTAIIDGVEVYVKNDPSQNDKVYYQSADGSVKVVPSGDAMDFRAINPSVDPVREQLESLALQNREAIEAAKKEAQAKAEAETQANQQEIEEKKKNAPVIDVQQPEQTEPKVDGSETSSPSAETLQAETPGQPKEEKSEASPEGKIEEPKTEEEHRKVVEEEQRWLDEHQEADTAEREQHRQRKWASERALGLRDENNNVVEQTPTVEQPKESESPTAQTERKTEELAPATEETPDMEITNEDLMKTTTLTEEDLADPEAGSLKRAARRKAEKQRDDAIAYAKGEIKDKPENFDYWKNRLGLEEPKAENAMKPVENAQPQKRKRGGFFKMGEKKEQEPIQSPSVQDKFEEEKKKFEAEAERNKRNEYASVLAASNSVEEAIAEWRNRAARAREEAEDWRNRKYKSNNSVVTGVNRYSSADEYETTIGAANERRRRSAIRALEEAAKEYEGFIETLKSRTGYKEESTKKSETMSPSTETAQGNGIDLAAIKKRAEKFPDETHEEWAEFNASVRDMSDEELLAYMQEDGKNGYHNAHHPELWDEYDSRHTEEYVEEYDKAMRSILDSGISAEEAQKRLDSIKEDYPRYRTKERTKLSAEEEALTDFVQSPSAVEEWKSENNYVEPTGNKPPKKPTQREKPKAAEQNGTREKQERAGLSAKEREIVNRVNAGINEAIDDLDAEIRDLEKKGDDDAAEAVRLERDMLENSREDMIDDALAEYDDLQGIKRGTRAEQQAAERREKSIADRKAKRMRELLEKLRDPNTSDVRRRAVVRQLADLGVDASGMLPKENEAPTEKMPKEDKIGKTQSKAKKDSSKDDAKTPKQPKVTSSKATRAEEHPWYKKFSKIKNTLASKKGEHTQKMQENGIDEKEPLYSQLMNQAKEKFGYDGTGPIPKEVLDWIRSREEELRTDYSDALLEGNEHLKKVPVEFIALLGKQDRDNLKAFMTRELGRRFMELDKYQKDRIKKESTANLQTYVGPEAFDAQEELEKREKEELRLRKKVSDAASKERVDEKTVKMYDFVGKDDLRPSMTGVYHAENGDEVACDTHILVVKHGEKDPELAGKIIDKKGNEINAHYPNYKLVFPYNENNEVGYNAEIGKTIEVDYGKLNAIMDAVTARIALENKLGKYGDESREKTREKYENYNNEYIIAIRVGNTSHGYQLKEIAKFFKGSSGLKLDKLSFPKDGNRALVATGENGDILLMPLNYTGAQCRFEIRIAKDGVKLIDKEKVLKLSPGVKESKGRVELNAATLKDPVSREYLEQKMKDEGWSEEARKQFMQTLDDAAEVVLEMGKRYKRLGDWNKMEILSETDEVDYNPRWRLMNRKGQWIPNRSAFKKNGEYPWNIDLGTLCTKRESFDALVQLIAEKGMAQNLGPTQIEAIKELLKENDFLTACDICFNETKRARVISYANQISNNWRVVSEAIGVKDKMVGDPIALTQEQRNTLHRMAGRGYKSAFQELIPESERRQYKGEEKSGNEIDLGITASMMQRIAKQMLIDPTLVGKLKPETLITTEGMDWFLRTYGGHTDVNGILASAWGSGTPKPIEGFNLYDPLSWRDDYDQKKENPRWHEGLKSRPSIDWLMNNGGFRAQSFTDYHPMLFLDYLQMFTDVGVRKLPIHIYTKVPALVKLFGGCGAKINMSLVPKVEDGVDAEHAGLKPDGKGGWEYAWDSDSFPIEEAFSLRQDPRFRGNVGIIAVGLSDAHILKMLDDPTIDQVIPYHKSGMPESVQIKTGLKNATDYTDQQTTGGKPKKAADFNFNEAVRRTGDPRKAASEYVKWCEMNGYTPKFEQFKDHPNYYKVLADFRLFDNEGKYSEQEAVNPGKILGDNWKQELENSLNDKTMQEAVKTRVAGNEKLMKDVERLMSKQRMDGAVRDEMVKKLKGALGKDNVESLKQNEFFNALEDAYKQTMGAEQAKAKVEVLRTTNGVVYGFASGGKITLNENVFNAETPIHEFTHIWVKVAQRENAKLWKKGKDLLKQTGEWQEVMNDDLYADIRGDEDAVASEVLARIVGSEGADYVRRLLDPEHKPLKQGGVYNQIKEWLREMFNNVRSLFAPSIRNLTYDEFVNMPLKTLFDEAEAKRFLEAKTRLESEGGLEGDVENEGVELSVVKDPKEIERLEKEPVEYGYRNVSMKEDGTFRSPMADKLGKKGEKSRSTEPFKMNAWEKSDENPDLATDDGKINLIKPNGLGSVGAVDYNPYIHIRPTTLNKQFKNAWERNDLVYLKVAYPASELDKGYHAPKAKLSVGKHPWNGGELILSRWDKPMEIVPWEEVANEWVNEFKDRGVEFDIVPPKLLPILMERGVEILPPHKGMGKACNDAYQEKVVNRATRYEEMARKAINDGRNEVSERMQTYQSKDGEIKFENARQLSLFGNEKAGSLFDDLDNNKKSATIDFDPKKMSDEELLTEIGGDENSLNSRLSSEEYDRRHLKEYNQVYDAITSQLEENRTSKEQADEMLCDIVRQWRDGHATGERTALKAQFDALNDYYAEKEAEEQARRDEIEDAFSDAIDRTQSPEQTKAIIKLFNEFDRDEISGDEALRRLEELESETVSPSTPTEQTRTEQTEQVAPKAQTEKPKVEKKAKNDPTAIKMRKLVNGEACHVERKYIESKQFDFTGREVIKDSNDIAYLFRQLENSAIENVFLVLLDKNNRPTILHIGMGGYNLSPGNIGAGILAASAIKPKRVILVHNHPSGVLKPSSQDVDLLKKTRSMFGNNVVADGIIIDITSGKYCEFGDSSYHSEMRPERIDNEIPHKVYSFSKSVFDKDWNPETAFQVRNSDDVAKYVSSHRLGEHDKYSLLVLDNQHHVTANVFLPWTDLNNVDMKKSADEVSKYVHQMGGLGAVLYGNGRIPGNVNGLKKALKDRFVDLLDFVTVDEGSAANRQLLREPGSEYLGTDNISKSTTASEDVLGYETVSRNTEQLDREYADAVEKGDTKKAEQMVKAAAKAAGYNYRGKHGSPNSFTVFDSSRIGSRDRGIFGAGFYFFQKGGSVIEKYKKTVGTNIPSDDATIIDAFLKLNNPYILEDSDAAYDAFDKMDDSMGRDSKALTDYLTRRGYDGVIVRQPKEVGDIYVAFHPNQIKSADPVTYDDAGDVIPLSERFNTEKQDIRYRLGDDKKPTFYSNAERAVENIRQEKATAEQWLAMIKKNGGLKAGEDKWMGLSEWLDENKGKSLTKDEVLQFVKDNGIQMEEVNYGDVSRIIDKYRDEFKTLIEQAKTNGIKTPSERGRWAFEQMVKRHGDWYRDSAYVVDMGSNESVLGHHDSLVENLGIDNAIDGTRLPYSTRGIENKREIAFKVPNIEPYEEHDETHFGPENQGKAVMWVRFGETKDVDGKRVLVIDEIQSNRHQDAREKGYKDDKRYRDLISQWEDLGRQRDEVVKEILNKQGFSSYNETGSDLPFSPDHQDKAEKGMLGSSEQMEKVKELNRQIEETYQKAKSVADGIPTAPFEKNWHEVAMKRILRLAAEEGFDKVAWTTGKQQAERYGIGGVVESITKGKTRGENTLVSVQYENGKHDSWVVATDGKVVDGGITTGENLSDLIGKELSEKVMSLDENGSIEGDGLRIGGEGMKGFYDQMLPRFMDKYGKKWGVKTGTVELPFVEKAGRTMHAVDVTPEMKESVMQGQPLFRKGFSRPRGEGHIAQVTEGVEKANKQLGGNAKVVREADLGKDVPKNAQAWYDPNTGEVHVVAERVNGAEDASRAVWHEEIGHKAMSELLGDRYNEWLDDVHKLLGSEHTDAMERLREKYAKELEGKSKEAQNRLLADEWIAELAERGEKDLSTWQKVKGMFRNWLWKHFGVMLGDGDIDYMLHKALAERRKGYRSKAMMSIAERRRAEEGNAMAEQSRRYRLLDEENRAEAKSRARDLLEAERDELNDKKTQMEDALNRALTVRRGDPSAENLAMSPKQRRELAASIERLEKRIDALNDSLAETDLTDPERVVNRAWDHVGLATEAEMLMQKAESLMKTKDILRDAGVASVENLTPEQRKEYDRYLWNGKIADARLTAMRDARPERPFEGSIDDNLGREPQYDDFRHPDLDRDDLSERDRDYLERQANDNYSRAKAEWNRKKERLIEQLDDYEAECDDWRMRQRDYMREIVDAEKKLRADWQTDYWSAMENNQEADALLHVADMTGIPLTSKHDVQTYLRELRYEHVRRQQHAEGEDYKFIKEIESMVDKAVGTGSLTNKVRKHGDRKQVMRDLIDMMEGTKEVTEEMKPIVKKIQQWFDDMFEWQVASGLVYAPWKYRQGYVPHLWNIDASRPDADAAAKIEKAGGLVPTRMNSPFMNERFYDTYEEGIQHGLVPKHESIIDLIKEYSKEVNKAVSNRQALDILRFVKAPIETEVWVEQEGGGKEKVTQTQWLPIVIDAGEVPPKGVQYNAYKNSAFYKDGTPQFLILSPRYVKGTERNIYSMFGEQGYVSSKDAPDSGLEKALGAADKLGQTVKQTNLSFSAFHAIALTEHMLGASKNPLRSTKRAIYDSLIESVITGKTLRQRKADVAEDAMSHFVKMGNSYDFDKSMDVLTKLSDMINNPDNPEWRKFVNAKNDKERAKAAKALIRTVFGSPLKLVKMLKKGNDFILWDMLHDGYKLSVWDMRSKYLRKQAEKKGWSEAELNRRLDDLGQTINDMFGGQHWELLNASPRTMRNLRLAFLSPDWNASWMRLWGRMAGMGKLRNDNFFRGLKNEEGKLQSPISGKAIQKAWKENHAQYLSMTVMGMSALMAFVGYSLMNLAMRKKDIEEELAKAEEIRKTDPNYKSPYEEEGIKPITWENFLGRANEWILSPWNALNDPGKGTYVYIGKDESGRGRYLRPGKQMRELFELFLDEKDHLDLGAWYKAGLRKMNPLVGVGHEMMTGYSTSGWENKELTKTTGWERELNRLKYVALHTMLPMSIIDPVEKGDTDKMWWRMAYPVSKGMGWYKGRELLEEAIRNDDDQMVNRVRRAYVLNGMSEDFESAYSKALGTIRKEKAKEEGYDDKTPKELFEMAAKSNDPKMREKLLEKAKEQIETTGMSEGKTAREAMAEYQQKTEKEGNYLVHCTAQDMEYDTHMKIFMKKAEEDGSVVATFRKMGGTIPKKTQVKKGKKVVDSRIEWKGKDGYTNADCEKFYKEHEDELIAYYRMNMFREGYNARIKEMKDLKGKEADAKMKEIRKYRDEWMQYASEYLDTTTWKVKKHKK